MEKRIHIELVEADALQFKCTVLALKFAGRNFGVDKMAVSMLEPYFSKQLLSPETGKSVLLSLSSLRGKYKIPLADNILFVGVKNLSGFNYPEIRDFARKVLDELSREAPRVDHVAITLHGLGYGLDESEVFESEVAGLLDAIGNKNFPEGLERISIVEISKDRVKRLSSNLNQLIPTGFVPTDYPSEASKGVFTAGAERLRDAGYAAHKRPHIFVAMPFALDMDDIYHYGIYGAANQSGYICERADLTSFTGDILDTVKEKIRKSKLVIADLTTANPNVYLEVGYAWGIGVPTVLLIQDEKELKFDVRGQRCLVYKRIKDLEEKLRNELAILNQ